MVWITDCAIVRRFVCLCVFCRVPLGVTLCKSVLLLLCSLIDVITQFNFELTNDKKKN